MHRHGRIAPKAHSQSHPFDAFGEATRKKDQVEPECCRRWAMGGGKESFAKMALASSK